MFEFFRPRVSPEVRTEADATNARIDALNEETADAKRNLSENPEQARKEGYQFVEPTNDIELDLLKTTKLTPGDIEKMKNPE